VKFKTLQNNLRKVLQSRIGEGELTGLKLAEQIGFKQAHISNFLNRKRGLSIEAMDKVLSTEKLSVFDLLDQEEINRRASTPRPQEGEFQEVFLVENDIASKPLILNINVTDVLKYKKSFLHKLRPEIEGDREKWERFIAVKVDGREGMSMYPRLLPGAIVLIDRHYNSLKSYRRNESNMYAFNHHGDCRLKYVEIAGKSLVLRPQNNAYPVEVLSLNPGKTIGDYVIGRICHLGIET
jgi:hypothetical protein